MHSSTIFCKTLAEIYCLQATNTTSSGAKIPVKAHLTVSSQHRHFEEFGAGRLRCSAVQTQRPMVNTQLIIKENVPRPSGSDTQLTVDELRSRLVKRILDDQSTGLEPEKYEETDEKIASRFLVNIVY